MIESTLIEINQKLDSFLQELQIQYGFLNQKVSIIEDELKSSNDWNLVKDEMATLHLKRLMKIYQERGLKERDLLLAIAGHFGDLGLHNLQTETENLTRLLPDEYH